VIQFYQTQKGDYVNFSYIANIIVANKRAWIVDEFGQRFPIGPAHGVTYFVDFLNSSVEKETPIVTHQDFLAYMATETESTGDQKKSAGSGPLYPDLGEKKEQPALKKGGRKK